MPIKIKLTIIVLALVSIPLIMVSIITFDHYKNSLEANRFAQLNDLSTYRADLIEEYFAGLKTSIEISQGFYNIRKNLPLLVRFAGHPENPAVIAAKKMLSGQLRQMQSVSKMTDIMLVTPEGRVVYSNMSRYFRKHCFDTFRIHRFFQEKIGPGFERSALYLIIAIRGQDDDPAIFMGIFDAVDKYQPFHGHGIGKPQVNDGSVIGGFFNKSGGFRNGGGGINLQCRP